MLRRWSASRRACRWGRRVKHDLVLVAMLAISLGVLVGMLAGVMLAASVHVHAQPDCWRILVEERSVEEGRRLCGFP